jgi:hypothetical protein
MRKGDKAKNSTISSNLLLFFAVVLSILMIVASLSPPMSSSLFLLAFASHGPGYHADLILSDIATRGSSNNNNQVAQREHGGLIGNLISQQQSPHADARNLNVDNKVMIEGCDDGEVVINDNDEVIQTNTQSFNQEANNEVGEGDEGLGLIGNLISQQQSPHADARNLNVDNKVIIVEGDCDEIIINDNDQIIQTNTQSFNQEANNEIEEEEEEE